MRIWWTIVKYQKVSRHYLVNIQKWRAVVALIACIVTLIAAVISIDIAIIRHIKQGRAILDVFIYFTTLANMLTALASSFIIPFAIDGIRKKRFITPKWLSMMHYSGTICLSIVFVFAMVFILPINSTLAIKGHNFYLHIICPLAVIVSFLLMESDHNYSMKETLLCLTPYILYSIVYSVMVAFIGEANGGWRDIYKLNIVLPAYISFPIMWCLGIAIAITIKTIYGRINNYRKKKMIASWRENADPVEVNIEIYGLGRYYGLHGEKNNLTIPYDILENVAEHYHMNIEDLYKVYTKGLINGIKEH